MICKKLLGNGTTILILALILAYLWIKNYLTRKTRNPDPYYYNHWDFLLCGV